MKMGKIFTQKVVYDFFVNLVWFRHKLEYVL